MAGMRMCCCKAGVLCRDYINTVNDDEETALHILTRDEKAAVESVQYLLQHGANVNQTNGEGESALHLVMLAATVNPGSYTLQKATVLLHRGADVNAVDDEGCTPAMYAVTALDGLDQLIMKLLCAAGADLQQTDINGETALMKAAAASRSQLLKQLGVSTSIINLQDLSGSSALHHCLYDEVANSGTSVIADMLLDMGADPLTQDAAGCNCLHLAVRSSDATIDVIKRIAEMVGQRGATNATDKDGQTALMLAIEFAEVDNCAVVEMLLSLGAAVNLRYAFAVCTCAR